MRIFIIVFSIFWLLAPGLVNASEQESFFPHYNAWDHSDAGCVLNGKTYKVGDKELMNLEKIMQYREKNGYMPSDGYGVLMVCTYLVDPKKTDHPPVKQRQYVWAAFSW